MLGIRCSPACRQAGRLGQRAKSNELRIMKILCIGDIVGRPGRQAVQEFLPEIKKQYNIDYVIANAENAAAGAGLTTRLAKEIFSYGCDVLTLGDHVWDQKDLEVFLNEAPNLIRPANFPEGVPGRGWCVVKKENLPPLAVINLLGRTFIRYHLLCPFRTFEGMIEEIKKQTPIIVLDMHAEATSEKVAMGHFVDGKISAVFGTHTHIQTADEKILPQKTAYITDLGMTGPYDSVIGQDKESIIRRYLLSMPLKHHVASGDVQLNGAVIEVDDQTGRAVSIERVRKNLAPQLAEAAAEE